MFVVQKDIVYVTQDSAATFGRFDVAAIAPVRAIRADAKRANVLYAIRQPREGTDGELLRSDDSGVSWKSIFAYRNYIRYVDLPTRLQVNPERTDELWLYGLAAGVQHSTDGGQSWTNLGFEARTWIGANGETIVDSTEIVSQLVLNVADPGVVYAGRGSRWYRGSPSVRPDPVIAEFQYEGDRYWTAVNAAEARSQSYRLEPGEVLRTGLRFGAWRGDDAPAGALAACRFQGNPSRGQHSRFITLEGPECEAVKRDPAYSLEGEGEFFAVPPGPRGCAEGLVAVKRFFNRQADRNHRYVTDSAVGAETRARGWIEEGIAFCARPLGENE
jgi:hypothetical protein